ncbi:MAG TPA: alpha-amylase family glycosyl hydrolase [Pseudonocardiaceae bacterium]|nr:alpha-amylase family glycosyl hydrolase [Pseudonocardiaceae bacterium]
MGEPNPVQSNDRWWRDAVIYQVYLRSFADGNGDGVGDLDGLRSRLPHASELGVDALWLNPWYPSPMADGGYDVADYRDIEPVFGTLGEAEKLIADAHGYGIRIIIDIVPNHCSSAHPWFQRALSGGPGAAERDCFWFRPGRGEHGELPPNNWSSIFGGPAWTRTTNPDGTAGDWYLHLFAPEQPDFNWANPKVRHEFEEILRFWFDRGVDGVRIDSAALLTKDPLLSELDPEPAEGQVHPFLDRDDVHDVYRAWRRISDEYPGSRALIGEIWLPDTERFTRYLRPDELHVAFNFDFLCRAWDAEQLRANVDETLAAHAPVRAPATWVLSNHDVVRDVTRYGRKDTSFDMADRRIGEPVDLVLGERRARAAALLALSLPGGVYIYQGEELGLEEVEDLPDELLQDPIWSRSDHTDRGRDGCRVPIPWSGGEPPFGFSPADATAPPWLPQPAHWAGRTVEAQTGQPDSMLELYRGALLIRRAEAALHTESLRWLPAPEGVLSFDRGADFRCVVNTSGEPVDLPAHERVLLVSNELAEGKLPPDTAAWLRVVPDPAAG